MCWKAATADVKNVHLNCCKAANNDTFPQRFICELCFESMKCFPGAQSDVELLDLAKLTAQNAILSCKAKEMSKSSHFRSWTQRGLA